MAISRRQFIISAAAAGASLIIPSFAKLAIQHIEQTGEPLLEPVTNPSAILRPRMIADDYELEDIAVADRQTEQITWRALFEKMDITVEEGLERWDIDPSQIDMEADEGFVFEWWIVSDCPCVHALRHLKPYENDLVTEFEWDEESSDYMWGRKYTSRIDFIHGGGIHCDLFAVQASDDVALSLLQHQLNRLGSGIRIESPTYNHTNFADNTRTALSDT